MNTDRPRTPWLVALILDLLGALLILWWLHSDVRAGLTWMEPLDSLGFVYMALHARNAFRRWRPT